jgi:hypothetical protein
MSPGYVLRSGNQMNLPGIPGVIQHRYPKLNHRNLSQETRKGKKKHSNHTLAKRTGSRLVRDANIQKRTWTVRLVRRVQEVPLTNSSAFDHIPRTIKHSSTW